MENNLDILIELRQISPVVAEISRQNWLKVPDNYFERFAGEVMLRIRSMQDGELFLAPVSRNTTLAPPPEGYFEGFAQKMMNLVKAGETRATNPVDEEILMLSPVLRKISRQTPYRAPEGFFEEFAENLAESAKAVDFVNAEVENVSPLMGDLRNKNVYAAPAGYFENFSDEVLSKIRREQRRAKVVSFGSRKTWLRVAAAAIFVGVISTAGFFMFNKNNTPKAVSDPVAALSKVSDDDMINYLKNQDLPALDTSANNPLATIDLSSDNEDAHDLLNSVSDDELNQYIKEDVSIKDEHVN